MLERLQKRNLLAYSEGKITLNQNNVHVNEQTVKVPLVGSVACGLPSLAQQEVEAYVQISTRIARHGHPYFLLRAVGSSMNKSEINDGDLVLVKQQQTAEEGERIVVLIDDEATVKHFHREGGVVILRPNSTEEKHKPIVVSENLMIQGKVVAVLPNSIVE
jgi:repressor LexA